MREVRVKDTLSGELRTLDPGHEVGIYACGPTVYSRIHIGNARPFVDLLAAGALPALGGLLGEARRQRHRHQRQDLRRGAGGGGALGGVRGADDEGLLRGHRPARAGTAGRRAPGHRDDRGDRRADLRPGRGSGTPTSPAGTSTSGCGASSGTASSPTGAPRTWTRARRPARTSLKEDSAGLRAVEGAQGGRGHQLGLALGAGAARLAHRVLRDGRGRAGPLVRDPRRWLGPRLPPSRERDRPVRGGRPAVRASLDAQRDDRDRRGEDVEVGGQHLPALRGARPLRARGGCRVPDLRPLSPAAGFRARADGTGRGAGREAAEFLSRTPGVGGRGRSRRSNSGEAPPRPPPTLRAALEAFREALADDFNTPRAMAEVFGAGRRSQSGRDSRSARGGARRCSRCSGSTRSQSRSRRSEAPSQAEARSTRS